MVFLGIVAASLLIIIAASGCVADDFAWSDALPPMKQSQT